MEQEQITLEKIYAAIQNLQQQVHLIRENGNVALDWENAEVLADEGLLGESWLSPEDEKAFAYLQ
ncbi:MAG: hypothetical protein KJ600_01060 [Nanoarchaeota archaeon]|nr:hypothetical protein [Nanoarchaeota archaeon]MBU1103131.1 hypothetical protein [Nanoarchaeota archaeon]